MLTCPLCKKSLQGLERRCHSCQTDVSLLVDYVGGLHDGLARAESLTREGELGEAVWAYLQVLEVDPDNPTARRQVADVAAAIRQFDRAAPGRRWRKRLEKQARFRRLLAGGGSESGTGWLSLVFWIVVVGVTLFLGYACGYYQGALRARPATPPASTAPVEAPPP